MKKLTIEKMESTNGGCMLDMGIAFAGMVGSSFLGPAGLFSGAVWAYRFISAARTCQK
jgi:hypothetical protein